MQIDIQAIKDRLFSNEAVRSRIARDFGLPDIQTDADEFAASVLYKLGQRPSPTPLDQKLSNAEVFRAAVRALGSNQRKWADYLGNESRIAEVLCGFDPGEASKCARVENIARWLPGQSSNADARAILEWAMLLSSDVNYYQSIKYLGTAFRSHSLNDYNEPLTDAELLLCIVGYLGKPSNRWAGAVHLDIAVRELPYRYWKTRGMGYVLASEFLRNLGWNGFKPDRHIARLFSRWLPEQGSVVLGRVRRLESLIGCTAKPLESYLKYSLTGNSVAPRDLPLSQVDNLVWLLGAYLERKGLESADRYLTTQAIAG